MNASYERAATTYAKTDVETGVIAASPEALVVMLYDGAIRSLALAKVEMLQDHHAAKGLHITKAIRIIEDGLQSALDLEAGGEIAQNLGALYTYMTEQLWAANGLNDTDRLDEVSRLLRELKGAWESLIQMQTSRNRSGEEAPRARTAVSYGKA
ncbi:MAG: flagellar export chaperone FliS [Burkholderiales bacterium]|nr:flagellar export chaperone FliS [Burkholderiales bacterium]